MLETQLRLVPAWNRIDLARNNANPTPPSRRVDETPSARGLAVGGWKKRAHQLPPSIPVHAIFRGGGGGLDAKDVNTHQSPSSRRSDRTTLPFDRCSCTVNPICTAFSINTRSCVAIASADGLPSVVVESGERSGGGRSVELAHRRLSVARRRSRCRCLQSNSRSNLFVPFVDIGQCSSRSSYAFFLK